MDPPTEPAAKTPAHAGEPLDAGQPLDYASLARYVPPPILIPSPLMPGDRLMLRLVLRGVLAMTLLPPLVAAAWLAWRLIVGSQRG